MYMAFVKAAQYLTNAGNDQDFKNELCNVLLNFFKVDVAAVAEKAPDGEVTFRDRWKEDINHAGCLPRKRMVDNVLDVLATGLFKEELLPGPPNMTLFFVPVEVEKKPAAVLIIGHYTIEHSELKSFLNEYLAVARLAGTIQTRIVYERELQDMNSVLKEEIRERHAAEEALRQLNADLEHKVRERTLALSEMNAVLEEEVTEHQAVNEALRDSRDALAVSEAQLKRYAAELTEINQELKSFANIVAHDFRAPMVNLKGFSRELSDSLATLKQIIQDYKLQLPEKIQKEVDELLEKDVPDAQQFINSSVDRLDRMITVLLQLARLGRREIAYKNIDMNELINSILRSYNHQITQRNIDIKVKILPRITTDLLAIEQIIGNLLDNAIKYLDPVRPGKIGIYCTNDGEEYFFSVEDNGVGIAAHEQEKIFDIFRRVGKQDVPGDGMGLAFVKTLIRQLGGRVWCEAEPDAGTKIKFTMPIRSCENETHD